MYASRVHVCVAAEAHYCAANRRSHQLVESVLPIFGKNRQLRGHVRMPQEAAA